jgi:predicted nucleotidyltransferase
MHLALRLSEDRGFGSNLGGSRRRDRSGCRMANGIMMREQNTRFQQAQQAAEACERLLKEQFGVRRVYLFGSLAGQGPWHSHSDIDLAVEGLPPEKYFRALSGLWDLLPEGVELDLITLEDASPELAARIKGEVKMPEDPKAALKVQIEGELISLARLVVEGKLLSQGLSSEPGFMEISAAGKVVHDFYTGVERIFERISITLGPGLPAASAGWHTLLLRTMETAAQGIRPAVIDHRLALRLLDYLRFRHLFRHSYGYELQWAKLRPLVDGLEDTLVTLRQQIEQFISGPFVDL